ncbi:MAG TPA: tetratricopeptide repeat protein [Deltaproteobacteria bacterium]|nr:tetratricopeptide repeat protein [Deltaproteobacteria bacterium]HPP80630.1 tetratricopeptide repeat protein [Deltaproteobacteria bacterium]
MNGGREPVTLGAVMIVKNEELSLPGILSDIQGVVDEICIVDTGSTDRTVALAEAHGAHVHHFPWCDDFSAARNRSIEHAGSDYLIWLDADDRIDDTDRTALSALKKRLRKERDRAYTLRVLGCSSDTPDTLFHQTRIVPNRPGVRFEGRVHEQILPSLRRLGIRVEQTGITIRHTGYHDEQARITKARRNLDILRSEISDGMETANAHFFMAMACITLKEYEECLEHIHRARALRNDEDWLHFSFTVSAECLLRLGRPADAQAEIKSGLGLFPSSALLTFSLGRSYMEAGMYGEAATAFRKASTLPAIEDSYPSPPTLGPLALVLCGNALEKAGKTAEAIETYRLALASGADPKAAHQALGMALLKRGDVQASLGHLREAKALSARVDAPLWVSLARIHEYMRDEPSAHDLYTEVLRDDPSHGEALVGLLATSIGMNDVDSFFHALERLMTRTSTAFPDHEIESLEECAELCLAVGLRLREMGENNLAMRMAESAVRLDPSCASAFLLQADVYRDRGETARMAACLEEALKHGADRREVLERLQP